MLSSYEGLRLKRAQTPWSRPSHVIVDFESFDYRIIRLVARPHLRAKLHRFAAQHFTKLLLVDASEASLYSQSNS